MGQSGSMCSDPSRRFLVFERFLPMFCIDFFVQSQKMRSDPLATNGVAGILI